MAHSFLSTIRVGFARLLAHPQWTNFPRARGASRNTSEVACPLCQQRCREFRPQVFAHANFENFVQFKNKKLNYRSPPQAEWLGGWHAFYASTFRFSAGAPLSDSIFRVGYFQCGAQAFNLCDRISERGRDVCR
jgi:hypothetical protein